MLFLQPLDLPISLGLPPHLGLKDTFRPSLVSDKTTPSGNQRRAGRVCADGRGFLGPGEFSRAVEIGGLKRGHVLGIWN
jgi:hypothetical protein